MRPVSALNWCFLAIPVPFLSATLLHLGRYFRVSAVSFIEKFRSFIGYFVGLVG